MRLSLLLPLFMSSLLTLSGISGAAVVHDSLPAPSRLEALSVDALLARADLVPYRGWLKFLRFEAETAAERHGPQSSEAKAKAQRLREWAQRIHDDRDVLSRIRGVQEWAYESPVDGSGQPFKLMVPTDYDPNKPAPVSLYMHGWTGDHLNHSEGMTAHEGSFDVAVLGRSRGGWYVGLSQADVLHVIDYLERYWKVDTTRIQLSGGSMGGGGTYKLASRYPQRFASGKVTCGFLMQEPLGNLLTFPVYATHSSDDPVVAYIESAGALASLGRRGGQVVFDVTTGLGHAAWNYEEGNRRGGEWVVPLHLPYSAEVPQLDYTATDGGAVRCWWAEISEWGPDARPARFIARAAPNNVLYLTLENVAALQLRMDEAPFDTTAPLQVVINGGVPRTFEGPHGNRLEIRLDPSRPKPKLSRFHTPGGPLQVYDGSPLLIVYGTGGSPEAQAALREAARAASLSSNPSWTTQDAEVDPRDKIPHRQMLFGALPVKADRDVTDADLRGRNLVLLGTAAENSVVARHASAFPVSLEGASLRCSDGVSWDFSNRMLGLVHLNPVDPARLMFWVAASDFAAYRTDGTVPALGATAYIGADLLVCDVRIPTLVTTRSFDSRWQWRPITGTVFTGDQATSRPDLALRLAESVRRATGADFAVATALAGLGETPITPGVTRVEDLAVLFHGQVIDVLTVSGKQLLEIKDSLARIAEADGRWARLHPRPVTRSIDPLQIYTVAVPVSALRKLGNATLLVPLAQQRTEVTVAEALLK